MALIRVSLYAQLRETLGSEVVVDLHLPASEPALLEQLAMRFPTQAALIRRCRIAVDDAYLNEGETVPLRETLDLIAPVSGG